MSTPLMVIGLKRISQYSFFFGSSNLKIYFITRFILCKYTKPRSTVILCSNLNTIVTLVFLQKIIRGIIDANRITNSNNPRQFAIYILTLLRLYFPSLRASLSYFCIYIFGGSPPTNLRTLFSIMYNVFRLILFLLHLVLQMTPLISR